MEKKKKNFFRQHLSFTIFLCLAIGIVLVAIFAPVITGGVSPTEGNLMDAVMKPCKDHIFGTDKLGRDIFTRVIYGTRISVTAAFSVVIIISVVGTFLGILAGYFGGIVDAVIMRISDMMIAFPGLVLALAVAGMLGASITNAVIAVSVVSWTKYARLARSLVLKIKDRDFVKAAIVTGSKTPYMLLRYMLPNVITTIVITGATDIGSMMLELAGLSFLGFGAKAPAAEWGLMLNEGRAYMQSAPWLMIFPGLAIFIVVTIFNLLGDSLRDVLDPRSE
ncbi:MAG: ABC transporter permease [Lachnospiraceae bacterium]|nr:ABC transporter permease [Lachnospiraceae bacterium]